MMDHVLLDMDGVLSNFQRQAMWMFGYLQRPDSNPPDPQGVIFAHATQADILYPFGEWSIPTVLGVSNNEFWDHLHSDGSFFAELPVLDGAKELLSFIQNSGVPFTICTSPSLDSRDATAKIEWMRRLLDDK